MSLQIITNNPNLSTKLTHILTHYFPSSSSNPSLLQIDTKYYTCTVPIKVTPFAGQLGGQEGKVDVVLFVFDEEEDVEGIREGIDRWVGRFRPESVMVCVNAGKDLGEEWMYAGEVAACQNFVSVVYENLDQVEEKWPQWHANGGLLQEQGQQSEIFSLLQLLQTTSWSNSTPKIQPKNPEKPPISTTKPNPPPTPATSKQQQEQEQQQEQQYEPTEQQLQRQMMEFEMLMQQMMQIKSLPVAGNQRKKKAEDLITKLARNFKD